MGNDPQKKRLQPANGFNGAFREDVKPLEPIAAPTLLDLTIDDNLSEFDRVVRYCRSNIGLQRLVHVKLISDVAKCSGYHETLHHLIPLLRDLSIDSEPAVKQHLIEQMDFLAKFVVESGGEEGYSVMLQEILPLMAKLLEDEKTEVRYAATTAFVSIASLVQPEDLSFNVLTIVLRLAHEDEREEMRMSAAVLLNRLASILGRDLCSQFVIPEVLSLAEDPVFRVRKSTALNFESVCRIGGEYELFERLMPAFVRLSKDEMYRVRRACAESLSTVSRAVSKDLREGVLIEIFLRLSQDPSKLVRQSVLLQAGRFISTLSSRSISDNMLSIFISLAESPTGDASIDNELKHECAFSFPAVLITIGFERWHSLRELYRDLAKCRNVQVKRTLAMSFHEVAKILHSSSPDGIRTVEDELAPLFEYMIQDVEAVQVGVLKYLALFFNHLSEATLLNYLPVLHELVHSTNPFNWRLREILAVQLSALIRLPPRNEIYHTLFSLAMSLLQDPVAVVRRHALQGMVTIVQLLSQLEEDDPKALCPMPIDEEEVHLMPAPECLETVALAINSLALFTTCYHRQLWLQLAHQLLIHVPRPVFEKYFLEGILRLTTDPVANVRIALSELLTGWSGDFCPGKKSSNGIDSPWSWLLQRKDIRECVIRLSKDVKDVYNNMNKLQAFFPDVVFESIVYTGIKIPPGGAQPVQLQMSKSSLRARYFSWSAVQSHFDVLLASNIITPLTSSNSIAELDAGEESDITTAGNGSRATGRAQKPKVNPTSIAMAFVRGIREKMLTRRNSFREELVNNMEQLVHHNQTLEVDPEIEEGEILLAKVLSKEITHSVLPASINASPGSNNIPLEVVNRAPSL